MGAERTPPYCPACGLFSPCKTCGKPRLAVVRTAADGDELTHTTPELMAAMRKAFKAGFDHCGCNYQMPDDAEISAILEDLKP